MYSKKHTKFILSFICITLFIFIIIPLLTSNQRSDIYINNYNVSEDGKEITLNISLTNSSGYIGYMDTHEKDDSKYISFYSTLGVNNKLGSKNNFKMDISLSCNKIYLDEGNGNYKLLLTKDKNTNEWLLLN